MSQFNQISAIAAIKRYPYIAAFGETVIAPLSEAPVIESECRFYDSVIYENGGRESVASLLVSQRGKITLVTKDISTALSLLGDFSCGENIFSSSRKKSLTFTPVDSSNGEVLTFTNAYLKPDLSYVPTMGGDHTAKLVFTVLPDETTGKLFSCS